MQTSRRRFLVLTAAAALAGCSSEPATEPASLTPPDPTPPADLRADALDRAVRYLEGRQADDGSFPSDIYAFWRLGQSTTGFVLLSLIAAGMSDEARLDAGVGALLRLRGEDGSLGFAGPVPDYPVYATALALRVLQQRRPAETAPSATWLLGQQFRAAGGWQGHPAEGGWGMGSRFELKPPQAGHVDVSMTRRVLECLGPDFEGREQALAFVRRCRADDDGFVYSPVDPALNKGLTVTAGYGTATADGLLALLALGLPTSDPEVAAAAAFLRDHHDPKVNPGIADGPKFPYAEAMRFNYRATSSRVFAALGGPDGWQRPLIDALVAEQADDGSFRNESNLQKEDDPLIATAFAVEALVHAG
jgi:hypothetical protein